MAVPTNEQIRAFFTNLNWQEPVIHMVTTLPSYPGANVGDRYLVTTGADKDKIFECTIPRRWAGAIEVPPRIGMLADDASTGNFWLYDGTAWVLGQPYFQQIGVLITSGGGGVTSYANLTDLKLVLGAGLAGGELVTVVDVPFTGDIPSSIPLDYVYTTTFDSSSLPTQAAGEPAVVIPDDIWGTTQLGAWFNLAAFFVVDEGAIGIHYPMPLNQNPPPPLVGYKFLTGRSHAQPYAIGTWGGASWTYEAAQDGAVYHFPNYPWALPGGNQREFFIGYASALSDPKWQYHDLDSNTGRSYIPVFNGIAQDPVELSPAPVFGEVYLVKNVGAGLWTGHGNHWAWLEPDGVTWTFSGDSLPDLGTLGIPGVASASYGPLAKVREADKQAYDVLLTSDGWSPLGSVQGSGAVMTGTPVTFEVTAGAGVNAWQDVFTASLFPMRVVKVWCRCTANVPGGTIQLTDALSGTGNNITDTIPCAVVGNIGYQGAGYTPYIDLPEGRPLSVKKSSGAVAGVVYIEVLRWN